ncbi:ribonuclease [Roseivivax halodurans JCM 10272]|uniref:Ribonuclease E n=1 Tax=Roseivivax halodurans JCM 10272 TaxID=1449350 RepID=X7EDG3_9RHOB|nr:ribonuclease E/G [Roseivivax halodurans]ETX13885.1 ribonuclease [Roseivivax halodurans JCM 10272]
MAKKMLIDATHAEETRVVVVDGNKVEEFDFESENKRQLAGNIYLAKVTRVEPSLQAAFVDYGGNRHGFLAFSEIHPDYYQIPVADRLALMEEEERQARAEEEDEKPKRTRSRRGGSKAQKADSDDAVATRSPDQISGMETIDLEDEDGSAENASSEGTEGLSPMETVPETPVEEPDDEGSEGDKASVEDEAAKADGPARADDDSIESVADDDTPEDIRPPRKPRPRKYKIQEVIKVRQILLVQVVKEERGNKGAALTTYLSLAGRYCVLMPNTARGGGISRKITNAADRSKLKEIAGQIDVPRGAGLIIRTAGAKRTRTEIKRDYEYLQRLWEQIRELTLKSIAPAKIYEEGDLIKRSIRDLYNRDIDEVFVEGERGYRIAKDFMKMIMPSHAKNVKHYADQMPLFARHQVESYLSSMFNPTVQLKSGGYIVIGVTEALVAIDVNSGRATKEGSIEDTAVKTNLEAAEEVARQLRLRDLAGLIVIDFIDMDERKNNAAVEKKLKEKLKTDRARIQVGRISGFGLLEMSRQRLRPGMIEATTQPCPACHGTGLIRSDDNMALQVLRQIEEEGVRRRSREVLVKCPVGIANFLINQKREHIAGIEMRYGMSVRVEGDPALVSPDFQMEKFKTATRNVPEVVAPVVVGDSSLMEDIDNAWDDEEEQEVDPAEAPAPQEQVAAESEGDENGEGKPKKRRRRRRRKSKTNGEGSQADAQQSLESDGGESQAEQPAEAAEAGNSPGDDGAVTEASDDAETEDKPKKRRSRSRSRKKPAAETAPESAAESVAEGTDSPAPEAAPTEAAGPETTPDEVTAAEAPQEAEPAAETPVEAAPSAAAAPEEPQAASEEPAASEPEPEAAKPAHAASHGNGANGSVPAEEASEPEETEDKPKPKKRGWWSLGL